MLTETRLCRFWWRDTRLAELSFFPPPSSRPAAPPPSSSESLEPKSYRFPYPTTFLPIPYHTNLKLPVLFSEIVPLASSVRSVNVEVPTMIPEGDMDVEASISLSVNIEPDGLLLYVAEASYESGTSPLSSWIPIGPYEAGTSNPLDLFRKFVRLVQSQNCSSWFCRLVKRRMERGVDRHLGSITMDIEM